MAGNNIRIVYSSRSRQVDAKTLEDIFKQYEAPLRNFLRARLVLEADRDDIVQEVFLRLLRLKDLDKKLASQSGNTLSYLIAIATNLIIDIRRRAGARRADQHDSFEDDLIACDQPTPESVAATQEQLDTMMGVLRKMPPKSREALLLNRFEHMSYPEVAQAMGVSTTSVERYIASALKVLREETR